MKKITFILVSLVSLNSFASGIYKIMTETQYLEFKTKTTYNGNPHDIRDGFIHMARSHQLERVVDKYYPERPVYLVNFSEHSFGKNLAYEKASNGDFYPHLFGRALVWDEVNYILILTK